jgi:hypothetical protein
MVSNKVWFLDFPFPWLKSKPLSFLLWCCMSGYNLRGWLVNL